MKDTLKRYYIFEKVLGYFKSQPIVLILFLSVLIRLLYLLIKYPLWWDAYVYIGIGKYIYSGGEIGIWESFRPLIHPLILGAFWKLGLSPIFFGKLLDIIFSLADIYLLYLIGRKIFDEKTALLGALLFSLTPIFIMFSGLVLTEPLAIFFGLLGIYLLVQKDEINRGNLFFSGVFLALSFLTKFPQGILFGAVLLALLFKKENLLQKVNSLFFFGLGFGIAVTPYLWFNYHSYYHWYEPFVSASEIVATVTWKYASGYYYYFREFFVKNVIYLFFFGYFYYFFKEKHWKDYSKLILVFSGLLILFYFWIEVPRKEVRYLVTALPFISLLTVYTLIRIYEYLKTSNRQVIKPKAFVILGVILALIHLPAGIYFEVPPSFEKELADTVEKYNLSGRILTSDPAFVAALDNPIVLLSGMEYAPQIYKEYHDDYDILFLNDCDLLCDAKDSKCLEKREELLKVIFSENEEIHGKDFKNCSYKILLPIKNVDKSRK